MRSRKNILDVIGRRALSVMLVMAIVFGCVGMIGCAKSSGRPLSEYWSEDSAAAGGCGSQSPAGI